MEATSTTKNESSCARSKLLESKDGAKDYKTKVLQDFLCQEVIETCCPQSNGLAERLNLTIMDNVRYMLIDPNLAPKLWPYAAIYAGLIYNNLPHSALR